MRLSKKKLLIVGLSLVIISSLSVGFTRYYPQNIYEINKNLDIFGKLFKVVNSLYVDEVDPEELIRVGIDAMLYSLDPYTTFISEEEADKVSFMSTGQYGGIGALVGKRDQEILIIEPYQGYPADMAGIRAGDQILKINQTATKGMQIPDVRDLLRGQQGTTVVLTITRGGNEQTLTVKRDKIKIDNVPYYGMITDEVGYISLAGFTQDAGEEVRSALQSLKAKTPTMSGVILDLRGNPGGRLDEAVSVANVFIPQQEVIVETRGRLEGTRQIHYARKKPLDTALPLVVLIDQGSASASEIVAGAVQDLDRGVVVGQKSFGKGLVQNIRSLSYNTQLKITTAKYYTPSGRCIQSINYSERDKNGTASLIPDSLKTTFKTRNGRSVTDGGGIRPDKVVETPESNPVIQALIVENLIFDFATQYASQHDSIVSPKEFHVDEALFTAFKTFIEEQKFTYETPADKQLSLLKETLSSETYYASLSNELAELDRIMQSEKSYSLTAIKDDLIPLIEQEIAKRYYYKQGMIEVMFDDDPDIQKGIELLQAPDTYRSILAAPSK